MLPAAWKIKMNPERSRNVDTNAQNPDGYVRIFNSANQPVILEAYRGRLIDAHSNNRHRRAILRCSWRIENLPSLPARR